MAVIVKNTGRVPLQVLVVDSKGDKSYVRVMPRNRGVALQDGYSVDANWKALNGKNLVVFDSTQVQAAPVAQAKANRSRGTLTTRKEVKLIPKEKV